MSQNSENRAGGVREDDRRPEATTTARESNTAGESRMDFGPMPDWTLVDYRREGAGLMDVKRFDAMAVDGQNLVMYDRKRFERDTTLGAWKRRWAVLRRWCVGILVDMRFADMPFVRCEQELSYCRRLRNAIDANVDVTPGDPELKCWFFDKPYTYMYLMRGGTHRTRILEFEISQRTALRNPIFVGWHNLEMFAVPPIDRYHHYVTVPAFWRNIEAPRMLCVPSPPMFSYYSSAFGEKVLRFESCYWRRR